MLEKYKHAASPHFDPKKHLKKIGIANQTTMYKKETQAIGRLFEKTMMQAYGAEEIKERFAAFDTICDATQVRQDAISEMTEAQKSGEGDLDLDLILVVGGWDSSNTAHLLEIPAHAGLTAYHVNEPRCIQPGLFGGPVLLTTPTIGAACAVALQLGPVCAHFPQRRHRGDVDEHRLVRQRPLLRR